MATDEPQVAGSEPRKKRAKIVSACGECRRRKTKCNGELPCRSCHKADVPCVYPAISHAEDKRNHLSKAALEAIEDRLKAIEDMLHTILQSQSFVAELPTAAVDQFLNNKVSSSPPPPSNPMIVAPQPYIHQQLAQEHQSDISSTSSFVALPPPSTTQQPLPVHSPQQQYQKVTATTTTTASTTTTSTTSPDVRLPSIYDLSAHSAYSSPPPSSKVKQEETDTTDLPPPLGYSSYYAHNAGRTDMPSDLPGGAENSLSASIKKRKRTS